MKKPRNIVIGVLVLLTIISAGVGLSMFNKTHEDLKSTEPDFKLDALELYDSFEQDENKANQQYLGKVLEVEGKISGIENLSEGKVNVVIQASSDSFGGINCSFTQLDPQELALLKKGNQVKIRGECTGFLLDVNLVRSVIIHL